MFGFGDRRKLIELGNKLKAKSLREVVEGHANEKYLSALDTPYDAAKVSELFNIISRHDCKDIEDELQKVGEICKEKRWAGEVVDMYRSNKMFSALRFKVSFEIDGMNFLAQDWDGRSKMDHVFGTIFGEELPSFYVIPVLFSPEKNGKIERFKVSSDFRDELIVELFSARLRSRREFTKLVDAFAALNPYFRSYPL